MISDDSLKVTFLHAIAEIGSELPVIKHVNGSHWRLINVWPSQSANVNGSHWRLINVWPSQSAHDCIWGTDG